MYLRISLDATGEKLAIERQRELCRQIIEGKKWELVGEYVDNSISASDARKQRPGYDAMVEAYASGLFDALVCYDMDRLTRQPRQMEDWLDAAEKRGLALVTANGEADLTTDAGRTFVRVRMAFARGEVERKSARQRAAAHQRAQLGRPPLGVRLTGYTAKGETVPEEAEVVKRIFKLFHAGESLRSIARMLTEENVTARSGRPWNPSSIRGILINPRYAGRAIYQGETTGSPGNWEAFVSDDVFNLVQARLKDPRRKTNRVGTDRKHLGSGMYLCAICEKPASSWSQGRYRCKEAHVNRSQNQVDQYVLDVVAERLRQADIADLLAPVQADLSPLLEQAEHLRGRLDNIESDYDTGLIDGKRYASARELVLTELAAVQRSMADADRGSALGELLGSPEPATKFLASGTMTQRGIVSALATVRLHPGTRYSKVFDPDTVQIDWLTG